MASIKDRTAIVGIGATELYRQSGRTVMSLALEACQKAIADAGLTTKDVDGILTYQLADSVSPREVGIRLGLGDIRYCVDWTAGGNAASAIVAMAAMAIVNGLANTIVLFRAMNGRSGVRMGGTGQAPSQYVGGGAQFTAPYGLFGPPSMYALMARAHMAKFGTTSRQLGAIAVTLRKHAALNPRAMMRTPITLEDHQSSRMIVDPFRLLDCCLETDGAMACVVTSSARATDLRHRPVYVVAATGGMPEPPELWESYGKEAAPRLYKAAGITVKDIDFACIYDAFTWVLLCQLEDFGFCPKGEGGPFVEEGHIGLGGDIPINPHGGLLCEGYVHGLNHAIEAVTQLRGEAGARQVKGAEIGLTTGVMGSSALILRR